jgi:flagellin
MAITIGSNIASLNAQRRLGTATTKLSETFERLSSGQRINKASDDAAGLSIKMSLDSKARVFSKAANNINDGISYLNIAEGALVSLSDVTTRLLELAEQAANGTYSSIQRQALNTEAQALLLESDRIVSTTTFNGIKLLNGSAARVNIQAGAEGGADSIVSVEVEKVGVVAATTNSGSITFDGVNDYVGMGNAANLQLSSGTIDAWINTTGAGTAYRGILTKQSAYGLYLKDNVLMTYDWGTSTESSTGVNLADGQWHHVAMTFQAGVTSGTQLWIDGVSRLTTTISILDQTVQAVLGSGWIPTQNFAGTIDEAKIYNRVLSAAEIATLARGGSPDATGLVGQWQLDEASGLTAIDSSGSGNNGTLINGPVRTSTVPFALRGPSLLSQAEARTALTTFQNRQDEISRQRGTIGAAQSRLETALSNVFTAKENYLSASAQIGDTNVAEEAAELSQTQILQQAGVAVLAQANQQPALALTLLRG